MPLLQPKCSEGESWDSCTCGGDLLVDSKFFHPTDIRKLLKRKYISDKEKCCRSDCEWTKALARHISMCLLLLPWIYKANFDNSIQTEHYFSFSFPFKFALAVIAQNSLSQSLMYQRCQRCSFQATCALVRFVSTPLLRRGAVGINVLKSNRFQTGWILVPWEEKHWSNSSACIPVILRLVKYKKKIFQNM